MLYNRFDNRLYTRYSRLSNRFYNRFNNRLYSVNGALRLRAVVYAVKVAISRKQCKIETLLPQITNRKWYMSYRIAALPMTLSYLQGHSPGASSFKWDIFMQFCSSWQDVNWYSESRGPSAFNIVINDVKTVVKQLGYKSVPLCVYRDAGKLGLLIKAKFRYTSWFGAGSKLVRSQIPLHYLIRTSFQPASNQLRSS